jgi:hypothetical protein
MDGGDPRSHPVGFLSPGWSREGPGLGGEIQGLAQLWERNVEAGNTVFLAPFAM